MAVYKVSIHMTAISEADAMRRVLSAVYCYGLPVLHVNAVEPIDGYVSEDPKVGLVHRLRALFPAPMFKQWSVEKISRGGWQASIEVRGCLHPTCVATALSLEKLAENLWRLERAIQAGGESLNTDL